jgi:pilus assembly protein CpaB
MKWSVVVLIVLGVVAALCAALIVSSLTSQKGGGGPAPATTEVKEVTYVVAARDLPARTLVESDATTLLNSPPQGAPAGAFSQQAQVIGQVLRRSIKKGASFDATYFSSAEGASVVLAGTLREGERAVSIPLTDSGGIESMLYPGCIVDVLASMQLKDDKGLGDLPISMTLLQGITVLAVGQQTIVSPTPDDSRSLVQRGPASTITLLVNTAQAEALYLARQRGSVTIALRNPTDDKSVGSQGTRLPNLSPAFAQAEKGILMQLDEARKRAEEAATRERTKAQYELERAGSDIELARKQAEIARIELDKKKLETERAAEATVKPQWETRVLHGDKEEIRKFDIPEGQKKP